MVCFNLNFVFIQKSIKFIKVYKKRYQYKKVCTLCITKIIQHKHKYVYDYIWYKKLEINNAKEKTSLFNREDWTLQQNQKFKTSFINADTFENFFFDSTL